MWDWLFQFTDGLDAADVPYSIVGSVASSVYGEPRATNDVDLVVQLERDSVPRLLSAFPSDRFYVPPTEVILVELGRAAGSHLNIIALETMAKADFYPLAEAEKRWFVRRRSLQLAGRNIWVAAPEPVIIHKLRFYREGRADKHLRDIRSMLHVSGASIDQAEIAEACAELGLSAEWRLISER